MIENISTVELRNNSDSKAQVTVCAIDRAGNMASAQRPRAGQTLQSVRVDNKRRTHLIAAVVEAPRASGLNRFRLRLRNQVNAASLRPVRGSSDLHVHQIANLAIGGRLYWGQHDGPIAQALQPEIFNGKIGPRSQDGQIDVPSMEDLLGSALERDSIDANLSIAMQKTPPDDEGFVSIDGEGGYPTFESWPHHADRSHQQVYIDWLKEAVTRRRGEGRALGLIVASAVHNDVLCTILTAVDKKGNVPEYDASGNIKVWKSARFGCTDWETLTRQVEAMQALDAKYDWYDIALNPWHACQIIRDGGLAVVVSLESDKPLSNYYGLYEGGDWKDTLEYYRSMGVTSLQIVHESDSRFCGAAQHRKEMEALQIAHWPKVSIRTIIRQGSVFDIDKGTGQNRLGMTPWGKQLIQEMVARNMPIDLAHGSVKCRRAVFQEAPTDYGVYDSHTKFEKLMKPSAGQQNFGVHVLNREKTFMILEELEQEYLDNKILIGLRPTSIDVYDAPNAAVVNNCPGSAKSFAQLIQYAHDRGFDFAYGTDFNTGVAQLGPRFGPERCYAATADLKQGFKTQRPIQRPAPALPPVASQVAPIATTNYYSDGMATIGWLPELSYDLQVLLQTPGANKLNQGAERYLAMWNRAYGYGPPKAQQQQAAAGTPGAPCEDNWNCASNNCEGQAIGGQKICVCKNDGHCPGTQVCAKPIASQNFCVAKDSRFLGQVCFTDKMCAS